MSKDMQPDNIKDMQKCILDILIAIDKVCKEHHLRYYLIAGTMLGAIRHRGFIPWDDDADVALPRKDYEKLVKYANEWLPNYYELVSEKGETIHVFPPNGADYYAARVYAKNKVGKKIYSEFSDIITAVRTPEISMSKVIDGNVDINIVNIDDYSALVSFNVYSYDSNNKEILLGTFKLSDKKININVTENTDVYVRAYSEGYESSELNPTYVYSAKSNVINTSK